MSKVFSGEVLTAEQVARMRDAQARKEQEQEELAHFQKINTSSKIHTMYREAQEARDREVARKEEARRAAAKERAQAKKARAEMRLRIKRLVAACAVAAGDAMLFAYRMIHPAVAGVIFVGCVAATAWFLGLLMNGVCCHAG